MIFKPYSTRALIYRAAEELWAMGYPEAEPEALWGIVQRFPWIKRQDGASRYLVRFYVEHPEWRVCWRKL